MSCFTDALSIGNICDSVKRYFAPRFLKTVCPHCQKIYSLPCKFDEKFIECPNCQQSFWVERYSIPVKFNGEESVEYKKKISEILQNFDWKKKSVIIDNFDETISLSFKFDKYLISLKTGKEVLYSAEKTIPQWKLKKFLIYFCTGDRDFKNMIGWTFDKNLWNIWEDEYKKKNVTNEKALEKKSDSIYNELLNKSNSVSLGSQINLGAVNNELSLNTSKPEQIQTQKTEQVQMQKKEKKQDCKIPKPPVSDIAEVFKNLGVIEWVLGGLACLIALCNAAALAAEEKSDAVIAAGVILISALISGSLSYALGVILEHLTKSSFYLEETFKLQWELAKKKE